VKNATSPIPSHGKRTTADAELLAQLEAAGDPTRPAYSMRYFRTGSGEYGKATASSA